MLLMSVQSLKQGRIANQEDRLQSVLQVQDQLCKKKGVSTFPIRISCLRNGLAKPITVQLRYEMTSDKDRIPSVGEDPF